MIIRLYEAINSTQLQGKKVCKSLSTGTIIYFQLFCRYAAACFIDIFYNLIQFELKTIDSYRKIQIIRSHTFSRQCGGIGRHDGFKIETVYHIFKKISF